MEKIIFLGTGSANSIKFYNACFALKSGNDYMLVDGGGGINILEQLDKANIPILSVRNIFVTHNHIDHIIGVIWIIRKICSMIRSNRYDKKLNIYASDVTIDAVRKLCKLVLPSIYFADVDDIIRFNVVKDREEKNIFGEKFTFYDVKAVKDKQYGFRLDMDNGATIVCNGDETLNEENYDLVRDVDFLIHEAFCLESERDKNKKHLIGHETSKEVCLLANKLNVKNLILYHIKSIDVKTRKSKYLNENKKFFNGNLFVPDDLDVIEL